MLVIVHISFEYFKSIRKLFNKYGKNQKIYTTCGVWNYWNATLHYCYYYWRKNYSQFFFRIKKPLLKKILNFLDTRGIFGKMHLSVLHLFIDHINFYNKHGWLP